MVLAVRRGQLELDIVRIAERQDIHPEIFPKILDRAVRHIALVENLSRAIEIFAVGDGEAEMIQPDTELVEAIIALGLPLVAQAQDQRAMCQASQTIEL